MKTIFSLWRRNMRQVLVGVLVLAMAFPAFGETPQQRYAKQLAKQRGKALAAAKAQQKKAEASEKAEARKRAADPVYAASQEKREQQVKDSQEVVGWFLLGMLGAALSGAGGGSSGDSGDAENREFERARQDGYRKQYWLDRARREADYGNVDEARRSLQMAQ